MDIRRGDVFCTANPWFIGRLILAGQRLFSNDGEAEFGHSGIITHPSGTALEALWTVKHTNVYQYAGKPIIIARPVETLDGLPVTHNAVNLALQAIEAQHLGDTYPLWRLLFHLCKPLATVLANGRHVVCSELVAKYLMIISARPYRWAGATPDMLADEWDRWKNFDIIYRGVLP